MLCHKLWGIFDKSSPVFGRDLFIDSIAGRCVSILWFMWMAIVPL